MPISNFEPYLVNAINSFFAATDQNGFAYRLKQSHFRTQFIDILVDSPIRNDDGDYRYHLAIEAKSVNQFNKDGRENKILYFSGAFTIDKKGEHQVTRITEFCEKCGRRGFLAVRIHRGKGKPSFIHFVPWRYVVRRYNDGVLGIALADIRRCPQLVKSKGLYNFNSVI